VLVEREEVVPGSLSTVVEGKLSDVTIRQAVREPIEPPQAPDVRNGFDVEGEDRRHGSALGRRAQTVVEVALNTL
jgi:hypothetical protein